MANIRDVLIQISNLFKDQNISEKILKVNLTDPSTSFDTILIKKLAKSNTITHGAAPNQTHIALTGNEMDIFPYLHNYSYLDSPDRNIKYKRRFILELPITLLTNNIKYLDGEDIETTTKIIESLTTTARSRRGDNTQQVEVSYIEEDDGNFVDFRKKLYTGDYIIFLKYFKQPKYVAIGVKESDGPKYELDSLKGLSVQSVEPTHVSIAEQNNRPVISERKTTYENESIEKIMDLLDRNPNLILYGPPGTGKTFYINQLKDYFDHSEIITFHQSYSYEQFVEGITAKVEKSTGQLTYEVEEGIFKNISEYARNDNNKKVALFIDEINRGNISKIFGELITLIEKSKRENAAEETLVKLPYSKKEFSVPKNLYIIGTMNTSDRSVALIDIALRRRFSFFEITPDFSYFDSAEDKIKNTIQAIKNINDLIKKTIDKEHIIGNSYFFSLLNKTENELDEQIKYVWLYQILPLLQEYYYTNPKTITDVLDSLVLDSNQRFSFGINYEISNDGLLETIENISKKDLE